MSIRERQVSRVEERLIDRELRAGRKPLLDQIQKEVAQHFVRRPAGRPRFQATELKRNTVSDPDAFNTILNAIAEDLAVTTEEAFFLGRRMMAMADYYETEKQRAIRDLNRISTRIESLLERVEHRALRETLFDSFEDFTKVNFVADTGRNLPRTTAFVDLAEGEVTLPLGGHGNALVDLSEAEARTKIVGVYKESRIEGHPENALNDHINESWRQVVTRETTGGMILRLTVTLPEAREANALVVIPQMPKKAEIQLHLSGDGETWKTVPVTTEGQSYVWVFDSQPVKSFILSFIKPSPDFINGTLCEFHFGAQRIVLRSSAYAEEGQFVSQPLPLEHPAREVTLSVNQVIPPNTSIHYYVAEERGREPLRWQEVRPGETLTLVPSNEVEIFLGGSPVKYRTVGGKDLYSIGEITEAFDPSTLRVRAGESMWLWEYIPDVVQPGHVPSMSDFLDDAVVVRTYVPTTEFKLRVDAGYNRYTLNIWMPEATEEPFRLTRTDCDVTVYLNNEEIRPSGDVYRYRFKAGWNQVVIYAATTGTGYITPRIAFGDPAVLLFAESGYMKQVGVEELVYDPSVNPYTTFAVDGSHLLVGYDPQSVGGVSYQVRYYPPVENPATALRLMAILTRDKEVEGSTPRLRNYRIHVK